MTATTFAAVFVALYAAHHVGDQWMQTHHQALVKGERGWPGRLACARHVASYTATAVVMLAVAAWLLHLDVAVVGVVAGQAVSAVTHYWADRRSTLRALADAIGKGAYYRLGAPRLYMPEVAVTDEVWCSHDNPSTGTGAYHLDQSWHVFWLFVAALVTVVAS